MRTRQTTPQQPQNSTLRSTFPKPPPPTSMQALLPYPLCAQQCVLSCKVLCTFVSGWEVGAPITSVGGIATSWNVGESGLRMSCVSYVSWGLLQWHKSNAPPPAVVSFSAAKLTNPPLRRITLQPQRGLGAARTGRTHFSRRCRTHVWVFQTAK